jgi:hypothetical protein
MGYLLELKKLSISIFLQPKMLSNFIGVCSFFFFILKCFVQWQYTNIYSNMTSLFPFVKKNPELFLRIISLAHAPMNVTDVSIGSINCDE